MRIRIVFEKLGWFTFVNHVDLPIIFSRAARRAGLSQEFTQGFSPHPHISLGPPLAIGVVGLDEPAEFWFNDWDANSFEKWNEKLPEGLKILKYAEVEGTSLAKLATAALYRISSVKSPLGAEALAVLEEEVGRTGELLSSSLLDGEISLVVGDLEHCGAGNLVRSLKEKGIVDGWPDVRLVRERVGTWDPFTKEILPLVGCEV